MAKKTTGATGKAVAPDQEKPGRDASGFSCYIGPTLKGLIQTGTIYRGTRRDALNKAAEAIAARPLVKTLIVPGDMLSEARVRVKTPGNILYANYQKLAGKDGDRT